MSKGVIDDIFKQDKAQKEPNFEGLVKSVGTKTEREIKKYTALVGQYQAEINSLYQKIAKNQQELQDVGQKITTFETYVRKKANLSPTAPIPKLRVWTGNFWEFDARDTRGLYHMQARLKREITQSNSYMLGKQSCLQFYQKELDRWGR